VAEAEAPLPHAVLRRRGGRGELYTENAGQGACYGERLVDGGRLRHWSPGRSKLAAALLLGARFAMRDGDRMLYLGAGSGTTVSHLSDVLRDGAIFAVERSPLAMLEMLGVVGGRVNVVPVLADALRPEAYPGFVESVDCIYQDVAQPNQGEVAARNARLLLRPGGLLLLVVKARSVAVEISNPEALRRQLDALGPAFQVERTMDLRPFYRDHYITVARFTGSPGGRIPPA